MKKFHQRFCSGIAFLFFPSFPSSPDIAVFEPSPQRTKMFRFIPKGDVAFFAGAHKKGYCMVDPCVEMKGYM